MKYNKYIIITSIVLVVTGSSIVGWKGYSEHRQAQEALAQLDREKKLFEQDKLKFEKDKLQFEKDKADFEQKKKGVDLQQNQEQLKQSSQQQQQSNQSTVQQNPVSQQQQTNQKMNEYYAKLAQIDAQIQESRNRAADLPHYSQAYRDELQKQNDLLEQKKEIIIQMNQ